MFFIHSLSLELAGAACSMHYNILLLQGQRGLSPSAPGMLLGGLCGEEVMCSSEK